MEPLDFDTLFAAYQKEIVEDIKMDEFSLKEKTMLIPTIKHKWVARMMTHKDQYRKIENAKKKYKKKLIENSPIALSKVTLEKATENDTNLISMQESLDKLSTIIEYLEKVTVLIGSMTYDCKNVIDLQKLETT